MSRLNDNVKCLEFLQNIINEHPYLRIEQILYILDAQKDWFNEEPSLTINRWKNNKTFINNNVK